MLRTLTSIGLVLATLCAFAALDTESLREQLVSRFSHGRIALLNDWLATINTAKGRNEETRLRQINDFVNQHITFDDDISVWERSDYWATPLETIGQGRGDCEDFAILKYISLRQAGVPGSKLRLVYVKAQLNTLDGGTTQVAHMVLAYYTTPNAEPLVLDNLDRSIRPANQRTDLHPVFSFNSEGIFAGVSGKEQTTAGGIGRLSRWEDALRRIRAEGFE